MVDVYLKSLMEGSFAQKPKTPSKNSCFDREIQKEINQYVHTNDQTPDSNGNFFCNSSQRLEKIRQELIQEAQQEKLESYLTQAIKIIKFESVRYLSKEIAEDLQKELDSIGKQLQSASSNAKEIALDFGSYIENKKHFESSVQTIAYAKFDEKQFTESLSVNIFLTILFPENIEYWYRAALASHSAANYELAADLYNIVITMAPALLEPKLLLAECHFRNNSLETAKQIFYEAKKLSEIKEIEPSWQLLMEKLHTLLS